MGEIEKKKMKKMITLVSLDEWERDGYFLIAHFFPLP
jgi:hypothetical protein